MVSYDHTKSLTLEAANVTQEEFDKYKETGKLFLQDTLRYKSVSEVVEITMNFLLSSASERIKALIIYTNCRYILYHGLVSETKESIVTSVYGFDHKEEKIYDALQITKEEFTKIKKLSMKLANQLKVEIPSRAVELFESELLLNGQYGLKEKAIALAQLFLNIEGLTHDLDDLLLEKDMLYHIDPSNEGF